MPSKRGASAGPMPRRIEDRAEWLLGLSPRERLANLRSMSDSEKKALRHHWRLWARVEQLAPSGDWRVWLIMAGRGFGKTRAGAEWVREIAARDSAARIALIGATLAEARAVTYRTVAGLKTTQMSINGDTVVVTTKESGGWRELLSGAGVRSVSVSASGIFLASAAEGQIRGNALVGTLDDYELSFQDGEKLRGRFLIQRLDYSGDFNGERNYAISLESSGAVTPA